MPGKVSKWKGQQAGVLPASCLLEAPTGYMEKLLVVLQASHRVPQQLTISSLITTAAQALAQVCSAPRAGTPAR